MSGLAGNYLSFELKGMKELDGALMGLSEDLQRKALEPATRDGAKIVLNEAKGTSQFKDETGNLRDSLVIRVNRDEKKQGGFAYYIGAKPDGFYGYFIEKGFVATGPRGTAGFESYKTKKGTTRYRRIYKQGAGMSRKEWRAAKKSGGATHVPAKPFMRPALDNNVDRVTEAIKKRLAARIDLYCRKTNKRPK